jgi:hypothetical protein
VLITLFYVWPVGCNATIPPPWARSTVIRTVPLSSELVAAGACMIELAKTIPRNGMKSDDLGRTIILDAMFAANRGKKEKKGAISSQWK